MRQLFFIALTLSDMSEVLLFFLFVSLPAVPAPAEDAPALFRRAVLAVRETLGLLDHAFWICKVAAAPRC